MEEYTTHIKAKTGWLDINLRELIRYRDLIVLFVKRTVITRYKQTILGPLWLILNPLITVALYALVFGSIAGLSTDGAPQFAFYLASNALWSYFSVCITQTGTTFTANAHIMGKVYFPRLVMPISSIITGMLDLLIQLVMLAIVIVLYLVGGADIQLGTQILWLPLLVLQAGVLGLGFGIIVASLTTKYRDLVILVSFGVQLWMYASPVVYTISQIPERYLSIYMLNPLAPMLTMWRYAVLGVGTAPWGYWGLSWCITAIVLLFGTLLFNRVEKTFMDTV